MATLGNFDMNKIVHLRGALEQKEKKLMSRLPRLKKRNPTHTHTQKNKKEKSHYFSIHQVLISTEFFMYDLIKLPRPQVIG